MRRTERLEHARLAWNGDVSKLSFQYHFFEKKLKTLSYRRSVNKGGKGLDEYYYFPANARGVLRSFLLSIGLGTSLVRINIFEEFWY